MAKDVTSFDSADDAQARPGNGHRKRPRHRKPGLRLTHFVVLSVLLVGPGWAAAHLSTQVDLKILLGIAAGLSALSFSLHALDKRRAGKDAWRIPESTLHAVELLGGWPGAFLAQRILRHKTAKWTYQITFWIIVLAHQCVAIDYVLDWPVGRAALEWVRPGHSDVQADV